MSAATDADFAAAAARSGRTGDFRFVQPHNLAFWLFVVLLPLGIILLLDLLDDSLRSFPTAFALAAVLWTLYLVPWVLFLRHEDMYDPEPAKLALVGFLWGGFIATFVMALHANAAVISLVGKLGSPELARDWGASIAAPFVEETSKAMGLVVVVLLGRRHIRSLFDGVVLGAFVGLGFQVLEDLTYSVNAADAAGPGNEVHAAVGQFVTRGFMSGLWSHALYTGLVGAGVGYFLTRTDRSRGARIQALLLLAGSAWLLHFVWDSPLVNGARASVITLLARFVIYPLVFVLALRWVARQRREELGVLLAGEVERGTLTEEDVELLVMSRHERRVGLRHIKHDDGRPARRAERRRLRAARNLATALATSGGADSDAVVEARATCVGLHSPT